MWSISKHTAIFIVPIQGIIQCSGESSCIKIVWANMHVHTFTCTHMEDSLWSGLFLCSLSVKPFFLWPEEWGDVRSLLCSSYSDLSLISLSLSLYQSQFNSIQNALLAWQIGSLLLPKLGWTTLNKQKNTWNKWKSLALTLSLFLSHSFSCSLNHAHTHTPVMFTTL